MRCDRSIVYAAVGTAMLFLLAGCGGSYSSPEGTVRSWLDALETRDTSQVREAFTGRTRDLVDELERLSRRAGAGGAETAITVEDWCEAFCGATVEGSTLHGDSATVRIRIEDDVNEIPLVRREGGWRIELGSKLEPAVRMLRLTVPEGSAADTLP